MNTRADRQPTHLLHTPDTFVRTPMPSLGLPHGGGGTAIVHASPALGAGFLMYTAELDPGATLPPTNHQRFIYLLTGIATIDFNATTHSLTPDTCAYTPAGTPSTFSATTAVSALVIEKSYEPLPRLFAIPFVLAEAAAPATPLNRPDGSQDPNLIVRTLFPPGLAWDFAVNTMTYAPGAALSQVEIHYMEHGLLMLAGSGPYLLGEKTYQAQTGDVIWMAPYCPQWFQASPDAPAKYLIYKNFNRMPML